MKQIAVIDNYDSFVYNLVHYLRELTSELSTNKEQQAQITVFRNDEVTLEELEKFDKILLSPGGGIPSEAGKLLEIIRHFAPTKDMLGVCLGHQALGVYFGASLVYAEKPMHGKISTINCKVDTKTDLIFQNMPSQIEVVRYHSLLIELEKSEEKNNVLTPTAYTQKGELMAFSHITLPIKAIQFHPEAALTQYGLQMLENWLSLIKLEVRGMK